MRLICALMFSILLQASPQQSEWNYLPNHPGKVTAKVALPQSAIYKLSVAERTEVLSRLTRLRDLLLAQPSLNPPRGVEIRGELGSLGGLVRSLNPSAGLLKEPVQAFGTLYYCFYFDSAGKPDYNRFSTWELQINVNDPGQNGPETLFSGSEFEQILGEPRKVGEVHGFPVYRNKDGNEFIVLSRTGKPYWLPITQEQYVNHWIRLIEADIAKDGAMPHHLQRLKLHKDAIARMSPAERQAQARHQRTEDPYAPPLAPPGSSDGTPLIAVNREWYNPSLPRTAFQIITMRFMYRGDLDPDNPKPTDTGFIAALRLWETLHTSDWKAISSVLAQ